MSTPDPPDTRSTEAKGFAGLAALVTDVTSDVEGVEQAVSLPTPAGQAPPPARPTQPTTIRQTGRTPMWARAATIVLAGGLIFAVCQFSGSSSSTGGTSSGASGARALPTPAVAGPTSNPFLLIAGAEPLKAPVVLMGVATITKPSTSDLPDRVLGISEIRWCLSQGARIQAARAAVDQNENDQIDRFNALLADFRPRCAEYRYRKRDMEVAEGDVAKWAERLRAEGVRLVAPVEETAPTIRRAAGAAATKYELPAALILAVIDVVAGKAADTMGPGRMGLMGVSTDAVEFAGIESPKDIEENIEAGTRRLRFYANHHGGDLVNTLAAYWLDADIYEGGANVPESATRFVRNVVARYFAYGKKGHRKVVSRQTLDERRAFNHLMSTTTLDKNTFSLLVPGEPEGFSMVEKTEGRVDCPKSLRYQDILDDTDTDGLSESQRLLLMRDGLVVLFNPNKDGRQGSGQFLSFDILCFRDPNINSLAGFRQMHDLPAK